MLEKIIEAVKKAREAARKRAFRQSFDLAISLKNIDLRKPENRIKTEVALPHGLGRPIKICVIADQLIPKVKDLQNEAIVLIRRDQLEEFGRNRRAAKKIAAECQSFVAEAPLMPLVGRYLGPVLAPRGLMPKPIPPAADLKPIIETAAKTIKIALKDAPVIHCAIGSEQMSDTEVAENAAAVLKAVESALPRGRDQMRSAIIKLTMGKPIRFGV
jgi:large subunit ribosomal protein L1